MNMSGLLIKMLIFMVLMLIGYVSVKKGVAGAEFTKAISKLLINVFMPATILNSILRADVELHFSELMFIIFIMTVIIVICIIVGLIAAKLCRVDEKISVGFEMLVGFPNTMFFALPVLDELFGAEAVLYCTFSCLPFNLIIFTYGIWRMEKGQPGGGFKIKNIMSPPLVTAVLAVLLLIFRVPVPRAATELFASVAGATIPISMILIGSSMGSVSLGAAFMKKELYLASFFKLAVAPLAAWFVCRFLTDNTILLYSAVICAASPSASMISAMDIRCGGDGVFSSLGILHTTVLSLVTIPAVVFVMNLIGG